MKKNILLSIMLTVLSIGTLFPKTYSDKTFLATRPELSNLAVQYSNWHNQISNTFDKAYGGTLQVTALYQHSTNTHGLGKYFGSFSAKDNTYRDYINVACQTANPANPAHGGNLDDIWARYLVHMEAPPANLPFTEKIQFKPRQELCVARFDFHRRLDTLTDGLFLEISAPVAHVRNTMNLKRISELNTITALGHEAGGKTLLDYFQGDVSDMLNGSSQQQRPLTAAKMGTVLSQTRIADIAAKLGYKLLNEKDRWIALGLVCTVPTGNRPTGEYVFEPICGNRKHWVLGGCCDAKVRLDEKEDRSFDLVCSLNLKYALQATERRTLGIKKDDGTPIPFGQYYVAGQKGVRALFPLANICTQALSVEPRGQLEGLINLAFNLHEVSINAGYNIFAQQAECVKLKHSWADDTYGIALHNLPTKVGGLAFLYNQRGELNPAHIDNNIFAQKILTSNNLNFATVSVPSQVMHKLYLNIGYTVQQKIPLMLTVGSAFEFTHSNEAINNFSLWTSLSCAF